MVKSEKRNGCVQMQFSYSTATARPIGRAAAAHPSAIASHETRAGSSCLFYALCSLQSFANMMPKFSYFLTLILLISYYSSSCSTTSTTSNLRKSLSESASTSNSHSLNVISIETLSSPTKLPTRSPTYENSELVSVYGKVDFALNGTNNVTAHPSIFSSIVNSKFSLSMWVQGRKSDDVKELACLAPNCLFKLSYTDDGILHYSEDEGNGININVAFDNSASYFANFEDRNHIVLVKEDAVGTLYINSYLVATTSSSSIVTASSIDNVHFGSGLIGHLDNIQLFSTPIAQAQVIEIYIREKSYVSTSRTNKVNCKIGTAVDISTIKFNENLQGYNIVKQDFVGKAILTPYDTSSTSYKTCFSYDYLYYWSIPQFLTCIGSLPTSVTTGMSTNPLWRAKTRRQFAASSEKSIYNLLINDAIEFEYQYGTDKTLSSLTFSTVDTMYDVGLNDNDMNNWVCDPNFAYAVQSLQYDITTNSYNKQAYLSFISTYGTSIPTKIQYGASKVAVLTATYTTDLQCHDTYDQAIDNTKESFKTFSKDSTQTTLTSGLLSFDKDRMSCLGYRSSTSTSSVMSPSSSSELSRKLSTRTIKTIELVTKPTGTDFANCHGIYTIATDKIVNSYPVYINTVNDRFIGKSGYGWMITSTIYLEDLISESIGKTTYYYGGFHGSTNQFTNIEDSTWEAYYLTAIGIGDCNSNIIDNNDLLAFPKDIIPIYELFSDMLIRENMKDILREYMKTYTDIITTEEDEVDALCRTGIQISTSSTGSSSSNECFEGDSMIDLIDGRKIPIREVVIGDEVMVMDVNGGIKYSPVIFLPHQQNNIFTNYIELMTISPSLTLRITDHHLMPVYNNCDLGLKSQSFVLKYAQDILVGECVRTVDGYAAISSTDMVFSDRGIYSLITKESTDLIVVNGIVASSFGVNHFAANKFYSIVRLIHHVIPSVVISDGFRDFVDSIGMQFAGVYMFVTKLWSKI